MAYKPFRPDISIAMVLDLYDVSYPTERNDKQEVSIACPFCDSKSKSLNINFARSVFKCHRNTCGKSGGTFKFVAAIEKFSNEQAKKMLNERFPQDEPSVPQKTAKKIHKTVSEQKPKTSNEPLGWVLDSKLDYEHSDLAPLSAFFDCRKMNVGVSSAKGSTNGKIIFPIERRDGECLAYGTLSFEGGQWSVEYPPPHYFCKSSDLMWLHGEEGDDHLVITRSPFDAMMFAADGYHSAAFMGDSPSAQQITKIEGLVDTVFTQFSYAVPKQDCSQPHVDTLRSLTTILTINNFPIV